MEKIPPLQHPLDKRRGRNFKKINNVYNIFKIFKVIFYVNNTREKGSNKWNEISKEMNKISGSNVYRLGKQCRERWNNHLDPNLNRYYSATIFN